MSYKSVANYSIYIEVLKKRRFMNHFHATLIPTMILENECKRIATSYLMIFCPKKLQRQPNIFDAKNKSEEMTSASRSRLVSIKNNIQATLLQLYLKIPSIIYKAHLCLMIALLK